MQLGEGVCLYHVARLPKRLDTLAVDDENG